MEWIMIPAGVILVGFILALCYYFFNDYGCFPCKRKRNIYENDLEAGEVVNRTRQIDVYPGYDHDHQFGIFPGYTQGHQFGIFPGYEQGNQFHTGNSVIIPFKYADIRSDRIFFNRGGIPTVDLHQLSAKEAKDLVPSFISKQVQSGVKSFQIITGKGNHSPNGIPILKPMIQEMLESNGLDFCESDCGGILIVKLFRT